MRDRGDGHWSGRYASYWNTCLFVCADTTSDTSDTDSSDSEDPTPSWIRDPDLRGGSTGEIDQQEVEFWSGMISQYLFPLEKNKVRNGSGFGVINFL